MKIFRILLLSLIMWNLPSVVLFTIGPTLGGLLSYATVVLLLIYYFFEMKTTPNWWIIIIGLLYFTISSFQYYQETSRYVNEILRYFVFVIAGYELVKKVSKEQLFFFLLLGSLSIAFETIVFPVRQGRYSGFYLNPNVAGFICVYGYALTYGLKNQSLKLFSQFTFTLMGLLTFSRTFIVIWVMLNLISLKISIKNIKILGVGFLIFSSLLLIDSLVGLQNPRFNQLIGILTNESVSSKEITNDSRTETWALFYDKIYESPIFGHGYGAFSGKTGSLGVHNTYLMILGESGIIPFLLFLAYFIYLFYWSVRFFKESPYLIMQTIALALFLLANHNFFFFHYILFAAMWVQYQIVDQKKIAEYNQNKK
ncbi:O-antigen ligase family protein [Gelidibacter sp.]|uniref:O-antigen ligase family protein n=1 Tax=Gelidibacter sp. TaxID=2018083 RepID=UPI0032670791